jgi:hypothetical protein
MVASFVSSWRPTGKPKSPRAPQRIAPKHAAMLGTCPADQMTNDQQQLFDRIRTCCPDALLLRSLALELREGTRRCEAWRMVQRFHFNS